MYSYDRRKTAAVDKVPVFSKFDRRISLDDLQKMVEKHYEMKSGSLKLERGVEQDHNGAYVNFTYDLAGKDASKSGGKGSGSIIVKIENDGNSVRVMAFVNIDDN